MQIQKTVWGQIQWLDMEEKSPAQRNLKTGIVSVDVGAHHFPHKHYDEQVNYVVQGRAVSWINGEELIMEQGQVYHWPVGVIHEVYNLGDTPFIHLMVSSSETVELNLSGASAPPKILTEAMLKMQAEYQLYEALESIRTQFLDPFQYPYSIFNVSGTLTAQGKNFPELCRLICKPQENLGQAPCMMHEDFLSFREERSFLCPYCMEVFSAPFFWNGKFMGCIQGGYYWQSHNGRPPLDVVYDTPENAAMSIRSLLRQIARAIQTYCEFHRTQQELEDRSRQIASTRESRENLMRELKEAEYAMSDLKINHHFLFNSLNSMAAMALGSDDLPLYHSIVALAKMFRYSLETRHDMVPLKKELEYVESYLHLQKLRYKDALTVRWETDPTVLDVELPFNLLQPVVENAFVHGFHDSPKKELTIGAGRNGGALEILIRNSGLRLDADRKRQINQNIVQNHIHGLSMINHKLKMAYGSEGYLRLDEEDAGDTCFRVHIPLKDQ
ncbi:MAG: histidine kinase [Eubacteriales bacterium]|nr:histidine kinase [Eubacteriales bacterium]